MPACAQKYWEMGRIRSVCQKKIANPLQLRDVSSISRSLAQKKSPAKARDALIHQIYVLMMVYEIRCWRRWFSDRESRRFLDSQCRWRRWHEPIIPC
jgi:hypothetical protein